MRLAAREGESLRINARLHLGLNGGVESVVIGRRTVCRRFHGDDEYISAFPLRGRARLAQAVPRRPLQCSRRRELRRLSVGRAVTRVACTLRLRSVADLARTATVAARDPVPPSDGTVESLGADVVHFPFQSGFRTAIPTILPAARSPTSAFA